jgi:hypothetical protein
METDNSLKMLITTFSEVFVEWLLGRPPALLALVGQAQLKDPERVLEQVIAKMRRVADEQQKRRMFTALGSLISNEEALKVIEQILDPLKDCAAFSLPRCGRRIWPLSPLFWSRRSNVSRGQTFAG